MCKFNQNEQKQIDIRYSFIFLQKPNVKSAPLTKVKPAKDLVDQTEANNLPGCWSFHPQKCSWETSFL